MNLLNSLFYRSKYFLENVEANRTLREIGCTENLGYSLELVKTMATIKNSGLQPDALLDIGAHHGKFAGLFNRAFSIKNTLCVEPNEKLFPLINIQLSGYTSKVLNTALAAEKTTLTYYLHEDDSMNSLVETDASVLKENFPFDDPSKMKSRQIETQTLDGVIATELSSFKNIFIKIDTQGNELNILQHGKNGLKNVCGILTEHMFLNPYKSDYKFLDLLQFMNQQGFECIAATSLARRPNHQVSAVDFLFIRK